MVENVKEKKNRKTLKILGILGECSEGDFKPCVTTCSPLEVNVVAAPGQIGWRRYSFINENVKLSSHINYRGSNQFFSGGQQGLEFHCTFKQFLMQASVASK